MKRLTENNKCKLPHGEEIVICKHSENECNDSCMKIIHCKWYKKAIEKLKHYEDLEEQGRLVKLPCKVGDTVYGLSMGKFISLTVNEISIFCMKGEKIINAKCQSDDEFRNYVEREFGKTVFLTQSEAEAKLKELRGEENDSMEP